MKRLPKQAGDTIVEVLISIGIISLVLGASFVLTNKSISDEQRSQEHSQALQLLQAQIEAIRVAGSAVDISTPFCMPSTSPYAPQTIGGMPNPATISASQDAAGSFSEYPNVCNLGADGNIASAEPKFHIFDTWDNTTETFSVNARWNAVNGGIDTVTLYYRTN